MAITALRLDGQTLGFQTTGGDAISVLSLNISTGAVASAYLTDEDIRNLAPAVSELFTLVPSVSRAANALGMLQRLITVASAGSATVALTATNVGSVYTLVATPSGASFLIAHLPFSADGNLAWATGTGGSSITLPLSLANGGTGTDLSAASGLVGVSGGSASTSPLVSAQRTVGAEAANTIPVDIQLRNGSTNYTAEMLFWGQFDPGSTLANITVAAGAAGQVFAMADFATSGRFAMISSVAGLVNLRVTNTTAGETNLLLYGTGPGTNQIFIGGENELTFAP